MAIHLNVCRFFVFEETGFLRCATLFVVKVLLIAKRKGLVRLLIVRGGRSVAWLSDRLTK